MLAQLWHDSVFPIESRRTPLVLVAESVWQSSVPVVRSLIRSSSLPVHAISYAQPASVVFDDLTVLDENIFSSGLIVIHGIHFLDTQEQISLIQKALAAADRVIVSYEWNVSRYDLFKSLVVSSSTAHLHLIPPELVLHLHKDMAVPLPSDDDPRVLSNLPALVLAYASRGWGSPFVFPRSVHDEDTRVHLNPLAAPDHPCLILLSYHGISENHSRRHLQQHLPTAAVNWELGALLNENGQVHPVPLSKALNVKIEASRDAGPSQSTSETPDSSDTTGILPFNLSLTDQQAAARSQVPLPYYEAAARPTIDYVPDVGDDLDDEDPDEDLEI